MKEFAGLHILEVWDFRLSIAHPLVRNDIGETWKVQIWANENPDYDPEKPETLAEPLEVYDTGIPCEVGDHWDAEKMKVCYEWLHSVRDTYSRDHIELRKPVTKLINESNFKATEINGEAQAAKAANNIPLFHQKIGELKEYQEAANALIKKATDVFHAKVAEGGAS